MGIATTRFEDRALSALGLGGNAQVLFEPHNAVVNGGVLWLLPALISLGLLKTTEEVYTIPRTHYYGLKSTLLTLAVMILSRIKNPEQLKQCKPGEIGRLIGLDRIAEVKCLREKIKLLSSQQQAEALNRKLIDHWYKPSEETGLFLYIDGHVRTYYGYKANLPLKYISRQKLCLNATTEYWVNDEDGMPVLMVTGELTEKLQTAIESQIIPQMKQTTLLPKGTQQQTEAQIQLETDLVPTCTLIFDREAYDIPFFKRLWENHKIAMLTYRKNIQDKWDTESFKDMDITVLDKEETMSICEREVTIGGLKLREIRRLKEGGHQTSIITNNRIISTAVVAGRMFGRWCQENFFRYMIADYDFDKMIEFGTEKIDDTKEVVNPPYRKLSSQIKKIKEKINRLKADFLTLTEVSIDTVLDEMPQLENKQAKLNEKIEEMEQEKLQLIARREKTPKRIMLKDMPKETRYNKLKPESKKLMNIIKMICYRAETAIANLLVEHGIKEKEKRMVVKQIINNNADIQPDYENNTLTVTLHTLSASRFNSATEKLAAILNQTITIFPDTNLQLIFKVTAL